MNLTQLPNTGVSRDTATTAAPAGLVGVAEALNQTGVFIYSKSAVKIWIYSGDAWSEAIALSGAVGSRTHTVDWATADRLWIQSLEAGSVTVRMVAQTGALGAANLGSPVSTWASLTDTPGNFTGQSGKYVKVKDDETGIEFVASAGGGGGSPDGVNGQIQYANNDQFTGASLIFDDTNNNIGLGTHTFNTNLSGSIALQAGAKPSAGIANQATITAAQALEPAYTDLKLLCHFEDLTDSSTLDNGSAAVTEAGSITAEESKFGSNSLKSISGLAGSWQAWSITATGDEYNPGTADFTIEFWMKAAASMVSGSKFVFGTDGWGWNGPAQQIAFLGNRIYQGNSAYPSGMTIPADTWTHIVIQRRSGTLEYYMNGTATGVTYSNWGGNITTWAGFQVGRDANMSYGWSGYIDELAVAIGTAKYTENFTVATEPHSSDATSAPAELWVGDGSNNLTQISPHNSDGEWEFFSKNVETGRVVRVNMEKMIKRLEEIHDETFMEEWYVTPTQNQNVEVIDASTVLPEANPPE